MITAQFDWSAAALPGFGMPDERLARLAARRAFVDLKISFMRATADIQGHTGQLLQRKVAAHVKPSTCGGCAVRFSPPCPAATSAACCTSWSCTSSSTACSRKPAKRRASCLCDGRVASLNQGSQGSLRSRRLDVGRVNTCS